jgi:ABC-type uncharacterized transport system substrate-binding protein
MCLGGPAKAHPHVFVDARTGFIFGTDGQLEALRISWTYDEFTTLILFESMAAYWLPERLMQPLQ